MTEISRRILLAAAAAVPALAVPTHSAKAGQPHMQAALDHLQAARADLVAADNDKGGHRRNALALVEKAIFQVERGVRFDRRH
jgi:hypothetical protein